MQGYVYTDIDIDLPASDKANGLVVALRIGFLKSSSFLSVGYNRCPSPSGFGL